MSMLKSIWCEKRAKARARGGYMKQRRREEQFSVIIASETDARKKTREFVVSRKSLIAASSIAILVIAAFAGLTIMSVVNASYYSAKANELKNRITTQSSVADTYNDEINSLGSDIDGWREDIKPLYEHE